MPGKEPPDSAPHGDSLKGGGESHEMWDLPLRGEESEVDWPPLPDDGRIEATAGEAEFPQRGTARVRRSVGRPLLAVLLLLIALLVVGYFWLWPKPPRAAFSPESLAFGEQRVAVAGEALTLRISNVGERPLPVSGVMLSGTADGEFVITSEECSARALAPQEECVVELQFTPDVMGLREGLAEIHGEFRQSPATATLSGTGIAPVLRFDSEEMVFTTVDVGSSSGPTTLVATNSGTAPLVIEGVQLSGASAKDFRRQRDRCSGSTLAPGEECSLQVVFSPRAAGTRSAELTFESDGFGGSPGAQLSGRGEWSGPALALSVERLSFGDHLVGSKAANRSLELTNRHGEPVSGLQVKLNDGGDVFSLERESCSGRAIGPGETCRIEVAFEPRVEADASSGVLAISHPTGRLEIEVRGRGVAPRLALGVELLEFAVSRVDGDVARRRVVLVNEGSAAASLREVTIDGSDRAAFSKRGDGCSNKQLPPGSQCAVEFEFRPRREGEHRAEVSFPAAELRDATKMSLAGVGSAPRLTLDREILEFGAVRRTRVQEMLLTAANRGTSELGIRRIVVESDPSGAFYLVGGSCLPDAVVEAGSSCSITVRFAPGEEGRLTARLRLEHDGITGPREVPMAGTGLPPPEPRVVVEPSKIEFGPQPVGRRSAIQTVTVRNVGTGQLEFDQFSIEGPEAGDFYIVAATCQAAPSIMAGGDCSLGVRFVPTDGGERRARLRIRSNAVSGLDAVELTGDGLAATGDS